MNRLVVTLIAATFAIGAHAQVPAADANKDQPTQADVVITGAHKPAPDRNCLKQTGSLIVRREKEACINAAGRSYSREDIDRTGARDLADALQRLDPSIRAH